MSNHITICCKGNLLLVRRDTAMELGLTPGQVVSEELFWKIMEVNAENTLSELRVKQEAKTNIDKPENSN